MILVTGATGKIGQDVVRELLAKQMAVRVLVRDAAKARDVLGNANVEIVVGDLARPESLDAAFAGVTKVFLLTGGFEDQEQPLRNGIAAAQRAQVKQLVKLSAIGATAASPIRLVAAHALADRAVRESGLPFTVLQPTFFSQNALTWVPTITSLGKVFSSTGSGTAGLIDTRDIAAVAAAVLTQDGHAGQAYTLTGPEALSTADQARIISTRIGRAIEVVDLPAAAMQTALEQAGVPAHYARDLVGLAQIQRGGYVSLVDGTTERLLGRKPIPFARFVDDYAAAFAAPSMTR